MEEKHFLFSDIHTNQFLFVAHFFLIDFGSLTWSDNIKLHDASFGKGFPFISFMNCPSQSLVLGGSDRGSEEQATSFLSSTLAF